jgi:hypothetical protein
VHVTLCGHKFLPVDPAEFTDRSRPRRGRKSGLTEERAAVLADAIRAEQEFLRRYGTKVLAGEWDVRPATVAGWRQQVRVRLAAEALAARRRR